MRTEYKGYFVATEDLSEYYDGKDPVDGWILAFKNLQGLFVNLDGAIAFLNEVKEQRPDKKIAVFEYNRTDVKTFIRS